MLTKRQKLKKKKLLTIKSILKEMKKDFDGLIGTEHN